MEKKEGENEREREGEGKEKDSEGGRSVEDRRGSVNERAKEKRGAREENHRRWR